MANKSSTIALNIQANTQKALSQFKSFSSNLQNKFLISGLQLDFVRTALSSINREFERYAGGGGLSDAVQTQQLTRSLQTSLSIIQGYSTQVSKVMSDNIGLALSKINTQVGGNKTDIISFTNDVSTAINEQVALGLTGSKNLVTANTQLFSLMQKLKLGYGTSIEEQSGMFKKVLLNQMSMDELLSSVSGPVKNLFLQAAIQSGGQTGNMAGVNRGLFFKRVQELSDKFLPSTDELIKTNPQAIIGKLLNTLFDDRIGVFGALRQIKLPGGGSTTILQEGAELLNAIFGEKGILLTLVKEIGRAFGMKDANDAALIIVNLIDFFTNLVNKLTAILQTSEMRENLKKVADIIKSFGQFLSDVINSLLGTGTLGQEQIDQLGSALAKALDLFAQVLSKALVDLAPKIGNALFTAIIGSLKGIGGFIFSGSPLGALLGGGLAAFGGMRAYSGYKSYSENKERTKIAEEMSSNILEMKDIRTEIKTHKELQSQINSELKQLKKIKNPGLETSRRIYELEIHQERLINDINSNKLSELQLSSSNVESERRISQIKKQQEARQKRMALLTGVGSSLALGGVEAASGMMAGESLQRSLAKGLLVGGGAATALIPVIGPFIAPIATTLAFGFADKFADALGFTKYNGNFPTAANGLFNSMKKESQMSGNKGLVIANQDEIIAPPHRMGQLAGMVSNMMGGARPQYALNDNFKKYQDDQKKQMRDLIREVQLGNSIKKEEKVSSSTQQSAPSTTNNYTNQINAKDLKEAAPSGWWDSLTQGITSAWKLVAETFGGTRASGNMPMGLNSFLQAYNSEAGAYGGRPVLANDKEIIISPRNYSTFASLLKSSGAGSSGATIQNEININVNSNGDIDTTKIANAVMKAIDTKYAEAYRSLSYV